MPFVENKGARIYWDEQGCGEPLLLIMGLSYASYMWPDSQNDSVPLLSIIAAWAKATRLQVSIPWR
ncbi:MAG TPA: hypothetical protein VIX91_06700 [Candidatus Acidoferrum sp.]